MDESGSASSDIESSSLHTRIHQLEQERDELQKDIEQLCIQQAGPSYIALATQMHFRRYDEYLKYTTAGLEQEIENLRRKLVAADKENFNLQEELSEAKRIKAHLDQLLREEVAKNTKVVKQLEYIRGVVTNAFSDRDHAVMEADRAKENEEVMSEKLRDAENKLQEVNAGSVETQEKLMNFQLKLERQQQEMETYRKVVNKFYNIRQHACGDNSSDEGSLDDESEDIYWSEKCACLYNDPAEAWRFNVQQEASSENYIAALEAELQAVKGDLQSKTGMALDIERHLKRRIRVLEKKLKPDKVILDEVASLREYHSQQRVQILDLLDGGKSYLQSVVKSIEEKIEKLSQHTVTAVVAEVTDVGTANSCRSVDPSEALTRALQEKVSALVLLSQQEERHLLEQNVHAAVQETMDELQRTLKQVTEEKVKTLMELAFVKQEYQLLLERTARQKRQTQILSNADESRLIIPGREGTLKHLLKRTSLKRWLGPEENRQPTSHPQLYHEGSSANIRASQSIIDARLLQIENATLKESMHCLERLTTNIHKLHLSLIKTKEIQTSGGASTDTVKQLDEILREAELVKTALGSALPLSWSGEGDIASTSNSIVEEGRNSEDSNVEKVDLVSAAGMEMAELLMLAARTLREKAAKRHRKHKGKESLD